MKFAIAIVLAAFAIVPALADGGVPPNPGKNTPAQREARRAKMKAAREARRAKLAAMTPEEREAYKRKAMESRRADRSHERAKKTAEITAKFAAAKAACGPDCYRVIVTNGVYVGMTKPQYEAYKREEEDKHVKMPPVRSKVKSGENRPRGTRWKVWTRGRKGRNIRKKRNVR